MLGVKVKRITTSKEYTIEELYEVIKDRPFSAGKPELTKHGFSTLITFPPLDRQNQVWIMPVIGFRSKSTKKFQIQKAEAAGVQNMLTDMALSDLTDGWSDMGGIFGKKTKICEKLVELTVEELNGMGL